MKLLHLCLCFRSWECDQFWFPNNRWRIYSQSRKVGQRTKHHIKVNFLRTEICRLCVTSWQYQTKTEVFQKSDGATRSSADRNVIGAFSIVYMYMGGLIIFCDFRVRSGFESRTWHHLWVELVIGASLPESSPMFLSPRKPTFVISSSSSCYKADLQENVWIFSFKVIWTLFVSL